MFRPARLSNTIKSSRLRVWLLFALATLSILLTPLPAFSASPTERFFHIQAKDFAYQPATLRVNTGDHVTIQLTAQDVVHGLYIDGYGLEVIAEPGQPASLSFVAKRPGSFRLRCSVTCGALHPFMAGKLNVGSNNLFWKALGVVVLAIFAGVWSIKK